MGISLAVSGTLTITGACIIRWWPVTRRRVNLWKLYYVRGVSYGRGRIELHSGTGGSLQGHAVPLGDCSLDIGFPDNDTLDWIEERALCGTDPQQSGAGTFGEALSEAATGASTTNAPGMVLRGTLSGWLLEEATPNGTGHGRASWRSVSGALLADHQPGWKTLSGGEASGPVSQNAARRRLTWAS